MARLTNEQVYSEIKLVKNDMDYLKEGQAKLQEDITMIKKVLLNPDNGTVARVNKNTQFRKGSQKTLWTIWVVLIGIVGKMIFWQ
jgi:hypothetical protein|tara:strand:- start:388 stop:642 length:255 start_codon:yes stop_codon:yes gene_type:complete